ncbi:MAG: DUF1566 domain-containing protein [Legionellaceae bacterium]|nr:DUF1566 domain-containing protein [Legionellaceae bacterium]
MRRTIRNIVQNKPLMGLLLSLLWATAQATAPLWTIVPATGNHPTQTVPENDIATVQYVVQNQSSKPKTLVMQALPGITQATACQLAPRGQAGSSCTLNLTITGSALPPDGVHGGPALCQANPDGSPNPNQCYQPSSANSLNISRGSVAGASITVHPSVLNFALENTGLVTVTNSMTSPQSAANVVASIPIGSHISVQDTTCGGSLAPGANCTITFTATGAEGPTTIAISGSNTTSASVDVTVTAVPVANLIVNPTNLPFAVNSSGVVTVTNDMDSPVAAENIDASIPGGSSISVQETTCGEILAIGDSCTITLTSDSQEGPTLIPIAGDNTNTVNVNVTVTSQPLISITGPLPQNRVVTVASMTPLFLEITNDINSAVNANGIMVSDQEGCPNLSVDASNCASVVPGGICTLELTSPDPYEPCTITVSGSNTANSPQTLIAFSYLEGLVFEANAGSGKVIRDVQPGATIWWSSSISPIVAPSVDDGASNTDAIVATGGCSNFPDDCAAFQCRNFDGETPEWYLPARNELLAVHNVLCSNEQIPCNFGSFVSNRYWSSTETGVSTANTVRFPDGLVESIAKPNLYRFQCVRAFSSP